MLAARVLAPVCLAAVLVGCDSAAPPAPGSAQGVAVRVRPPSAKVSSGGAVAFAADVTGTIETRVIWSVVEASGGTIDATGQYVAPSTPGGYHVRATSVAEPSVTADAVVTVTPPIQVSVSPRTPSVAPGGTIAFTAVVTNATDASVTWTVQGTSCGTITPAGLYTAPATAGACTVTATSREDPARSDGTTVTITPPPPPITVAISPSPAAVDACQPLQLTATVSNTTNRAVTWTVQEGATGGSVDGTGLYIAPAAAGVYHVAATSVADPSRSTVTAVTVREKVLSVVVSPSAVTLRAGTSTRFVATVTTTCGAFTSTTTLVAAP